MSAALVLAVIAFAVIVLAVVVLAARIAPAAGRRPKDPFSPFQFWRWDPARGSPPLQDPLAYRSRLFRGAYGGGPAPAARGPLWLGPGYGMPLQVSAA